MTKLNLTLTLSTALGLTFLINSPLGAAQDHELEVAEKNESVTEYLDDAALTTKVKAALVAERHLKARDIHVITTQNVVELQGNVNSLSEKQRAEDIAAHVKGIIKVINNLKISLPQSMAEKAQTKAQAVEKYVDEATVTAKDTALTAKVKAALLADRHLKATDITVTTNQNSVELTGTVPTLAEKQKAQHIAANVTGTKDVVNNLSVK